MKTYIIGIYNGHDVDDYYVKAESAEQAILVACQQAGASKKDVYVVR